MRSNHYDPDEDEEYYRKQLSYFDRRSFDSKAMGQPGPGINRFHDLAKPAQLSYPYNRYANIPCASTVGCCTRFLNSSVIAALFVFTHCRVESLEKVSPVEKRYEPLPQISPSTQYGAPASTIPPSTLPKLSPNDGKLPNVQTLLCTEMYRTAQSQTDLPFSI